MIKFRKNILFALFLSVIVTNLPAQDSVFVRDVIVEREFQPVIKNAGKLNINPQPIEPEVKLMSAHYTDFYLPLSINNNIHPLSAAEFSPSNSQEQNGFARLGLGNFYNTSADFFYSLLNRPDMQLDVFFNHLGTFGDKLHSTSKAGLAFDKYLNNMDLFAGLDGQYERLKYYGSNFNLNSPVDLNALTHIYGNETFTEQKLISISRPPLSYSLQQLAENSNAEETFWRFHVYGGIRSLPSAEDIKFLAKLDYQLFDNQYGIKENQIHLSGGVTMPYKDNTLGLNMELYQMKYSSQAADSFNFWDYYSVIMLNPYYAIEHPDWKVKLGIKAAFSMQQGRPFSPSADIEAEWKAIPQWLAFYGGISGNYAINSMNKIFEENCFLYPDLRIKDTYTPFESYAGIKIKPANKFMIDFFADYRYIDQQYFFVNKEYVSPQINAPDSVLYTNRFNVVYSDASHFKSGGRLAFNDEKNRFNAEFRAAYNWWKTKNTTFAWLQPKWEADLKAGVGLTSNMNANVCLFYKDGRYAQWGNEAVKMDNILDLNLGASYVFNKSLSAYLHLNNLLNSHYQYFYGYDVQGFNFMIGAALSF
jgi:hypothetical protein